MKRQINETLLRSLWFTDIENRELAKRLGVSTSSLWEVRKQYGLPGRKREHNMPTDDPTPEDIKQRCMDIRRGWTQEEEAQRFVGKKSCWVPPECGSIRAIFCVVTLLAAVSLTGCQERTYNVRLVRPDGVTHKSFAVTTLVKPSLVVRDGGVGLHVGMNEYAAPSGWMFEVEERVHLPPAVLNQAEAGHE
jgi:hypothetical protein